MIPGIEEMLLSHAKQNGLRRLDVGTMEVNGASRFIVTGWWRKIGDENPCEAAHGESVVEAFGKMLDQADAKRADARASIQGDAA